MSDAIGNMRPGISLGQYPQRSDETLDSFDRAGERLRKRLTRSRTISFDHFCKELAKLQHKLPNRADHTAKVHLLRLRRELRSSGLQSKSVLETLALLRLFADRFLGMKPYDEQLYAAYVITQGTLAEMATGEGKSLTAALASACVALAGIPVHTLTTNDYLAQRDAEEMRLFFKALGLSSGAVLSDMTTVERRNIYANDIAYCTNKQVAFDYLRDRMITGGDENRLRQTMAQYTPEEGPVLRGLCFAIVDEADSIFIDEACTPLLLSREVEDKEREQLYRQALAIASKLEADTHYQLNPATRELRLTDQGLQCLDKQRSALQGLWKGQRRARYLLQQALTALHLFKRNAHYIVREGKVEIVDQHTGRSMPDRAWEQGLHQLIECKEGCALSGQRETLARISYQRFFRRYLTLAGMSGTLQETGNELQQVYELDIVAIPRHRKNQVAAAREYVFADDRTRNIALLKRLKALHKTGQPVLIATSSVATSHRISTLLKKVGLSHEVLNALQDAEEAATVAKAGQAGAITVASNMAGRGTDIKLGNSVAELGGLHVISIDRNESRRVDRQLFGRCGRQGDPGSTEVFLSLQSELLTHFYSPALIQVLQKTVLLRCLNRWQPAARLLSYLPQSALQKKHKQQRSNTLAQDQQLKDYLAFAGRE